MVGYQAAGAAPFLRGAPVEQPETVATAIRIGNPQSWELAKAAVAESSGWFDEVTDQELLDTQSLLASREGVFCEPASAVSVCGALRDIKSGKIAEGSLVTCTVTGHGLKDTATAIEGRDAVQTVAAELSAVKRVYTARLYRKLSVQKSSVLKSDACVASLQIKPYFSPGECSRW